MAPLSLSEAQQQLRSAKMDLETTKINSKSRCRGNDSFKPGYEALTKFANTCRFELKSSNYLNAVEFLSGENLSFREANQHCVAQLQSRISAFKTNSSQVRDHENLVSTSLNISAETALLILINANLLSRADSSLIFMREHFCFPDDKSFLQHKILTFPKLYIPARDFLLFTSISKNKNKFLFSSSSLTNKLLPETRGATRGTCFVGFEIVPKRSTKCEITYFQSLDLNIWIPRMKLKEIIEQDMNILLNNIEAIGQELENNPSNLQNLQKQYLPADFLSSRRPILKNKNVSFDSDETESEYSPDEYDSYFSPGSVDSLDYSSVYSDRSDSVYSDDTLDLKDISLEDLKQLKRELDEEFDKNVSDNSSYYSEDERSITSSTSLESNVVSDSDLDKDLLSDYSILSSEVDSILS
eukprot:snap_masked-scaffold_6-processed-gene-8.31-mRNA-1 protein AED:1.00 eAED:1.00 QI:0/-1/0/0/-1/1/1/0/412